MQSNRTSLELGMIALIRVGGLSPEKKKKKGKKKRKKNITKIGVDCFECQSFVGCYESHPQQAR